MDWELLTREVGRVFTPASPIDDFGLFADRPEQVRLIVDAVHQKGQHAMLYGERGVGKTSLANMLSFILSVPDEDVSLVAARVNCDAQDTYSMVWRKLFRAVLRRVDVTQEEDGMGFKATPRRTVVDMKEIVPSEVTPDDVLLLLEMFSEHSAPVLIVDEFDQLPAPQRKAFADTIKALSDHAVDATVLIVGVADSVDALISEHLSIERALVQVHMPRMAPKEVRNILDTGVGHLRMTIEERARNRIVSLSQGLPHYAHLLGRDATRTALDSRSLEVSVASVDAAVEKAIKGSQQTIRSAYELAVRSAKKESLFADVLLACALSETNEFGYFAAVDVRDALNRITGKRYEIPAYAQHLTEFCDAKRGSILEKSGSPRLFRYRFRNPLVQPFVIMQGLNSGKIDGNTVDTLGLRGW